MPIHSRTYPPDLSFGAAYEEVRQFMLRINSDGLVTPYFTWAAWEWFFCLRHRSEEDVAQYRIWEDGSGVVGISMWYDKPSDWYIDADPRNLDLKRHMIEKVRAAHALDAPLRICVGDADPAYHAIMRNLGFRPTGDTENTSMIDLTGDLSYHLPDGFTIIDSAAGFDLLKFNRCLWRGFNREGEPDTSEARLDFRRRQLSGPNQDPTLRVMVVAPNGDYVSYCGMWHEPGTTYVYVEPVCTDPDYRKLGLGKAAVLEGCRRCAVRGATNATVFSNQQFYYNLGFNPLPSERWWSDTPAR